MSLDVTLTTPKCKECGRSEELWSANITHNLNEMAEAALIYKHLWRPEELGITKARDLIEPLQEGLRYLRSDPMLFSRYNPVNGWGNYGILVEFVAGYLKACEEHPDADVKAER